MAANLATTELQRPSGHDADLGLSQLGIDVLESLPVSVVVFDADWSVAYRNAAARWLLGGGDTIRDVLGPDAIGGEYRDWAEEFRTVCETSTPQRYANVVHERRDGAQRLIDFVCTPLHRPNVDKAVGAILIAEDVTDRVSLEQRLAVSERLASVGRLAARVAHELNNPLDGIRRYVNLALRLGEKLPEPERRILDYLGEARTGLMRMTQIIRELLKFSRSATAFSEHTDVNRIVEEAVRTLSENASAVGVVVACQFDAAETPAIRGSMLYQVCCNLIKNAIDAMPGGGRLTITTGVADGDAVLRFEDTGVGLPEDVDKVFEPFYTTKKPGEGTGLGLAICKDYIERVGGRLTARTRDEGGAEFTIHVPLPGLARM